MEDDLKRSITAGETWIRGAFMLLFALVVQVVELVLAVLAIVQWLFLLFTRAPSERLLEFGDDMTLYNYQIWQFLTLNSEARPWPFAPWPYSTEGLDETPEPGVSTGAAAQFGAADPEPSQSTESAGAPAGPGMTDDAVPPVTDGEANPAGPGMDAEDKDKPAGS